MRIIPNRLADQNLSASDQSRMPEFTSFKTSGPISYPSRWHRDFLIQATLDKSIDLIEPTNSQNFDSAAFSVNITILSNTLHVTAFRNSASDTNNDRGKNIVPIFRSFVLEEPRCSAARAVWSNRGKLVSPRNQLQIIEILRSETSGISIDRLLEHLTTPVDDPIETIFALCCTGYITIDISNGPSSEMLICGSKLPRRVNGGISQALNCSFSRAK